MDGLPNDSESDVIYLWRLPFAYLLGEPHGMIRVCVYVCVCLCVVSFYDCLCQVRHLDWVNWVWPSELKQSQTDSTNDMRKMMYPKVQK